MGDSEKVSGLNTGDGGSNKKSAELYSSTLYKW